MHHVFVVSDLHIGGKPPMDDGPGFQMCPPQSRRRLARLIERISSQCGLLTAADTSEIVINGDFIDFLAEAPFKDFSSDDAVEKFKRSIRLCDEGAAVGERVFAALRRFVGGGNKLTILLGNHDIELSLPDVRRELIYVLTEGSPAKVEFIFDGEAYAIGDVLIEHGNRYDGWNTVAHGQLRAFRSSVSRGETRWPFAAPAGSRLVASMMNPIKERYRFIDLLKPENEAILPILCALEPSLAGELHKAVPLWFAKRKATGEPGRVRQEETYIADEAGDVRIAESMAHSMTETGYGSQSNRAQPFVETLEGDHIDEQTRRATEKILAECMESARAAGADDLEARVGPDQTQVADDGRDTWLSSALSLWKARKTKPALRYRLLAAALARHRKAIATTFDLNTADPPYCTAAAQLASNQSTRYVIFGHTHLAKALPLPKGAHYLNTGTWCPTIQLEPRFYEADANDKVAAELAAFVDDLSSNNLAPWSKLQTNFAHVRMGEGRPSQAALCQFMEDGSITNLWVDSP